MSNEILKQIKCFILDLDGTLYLGNKVIGGAIEFVKKIRQSGRKLIFLTNNSSKSAADYLIKINNLGFEADINEILTSGVVAADYINKNYYGKKVYLIGTKSLQDELHGCGIKLSENDADIVLLSYDTELTYDKLAKGCRLISEGAIYISTHPDINCPSETGLLPDAGSFMELIKASTNKSCDIICGKPYNIMAKYISKKLNVSPECIAMVGDRLSTDILFANNNGFKSALVLSGETDIKIYEGSKIKADFVFDSVKDIISNI
ncbi:MAG: HAD-IIA family hydrolase [Clostridia bacterium]|nr:HAD-IIA family hydrolase [Clostridia bacterium]